MPPLTPGGTKEEPPPLCFKCSGRPGKHPMDTGERIELVCCECMDRMMNEMLKLIQEIREAVR